MAVLLQLADKLNVHEPALSRHWMLSKGPNKSDGNRDRW